MADERLGGLSGAAALLGHRTARPKLSRLAEMVDGAKPQGPAPMGRPGLDEGEPEKDEGRGANPQIPNPKPQTPNPESQGRTGKPGGKDGRLVADASAVGPAGDSEPDPAYTQAARRERPYSLEHEKPHAEQRFGRGARARGLYPAGVGAGFALARQRAAGKT